MTRAFCANCDKRITKQRNGAWYHDHNSSVSCRPGEGRDHRAGPKYPKDDAGPVATSSTRVAGSSAVARLARTTS